MNELENFDVISTKSLGLGLIHTACKLSGEQTDLTSGVFRYEYTLGELVSMATRHIEAEL